VVKVKKDSIKRCKVCLAKLDNGSVSDLCPVCKRFASIEERLVKVERHVSFDTPLAITPIAK